VGAGLISYSFATCFGVTLFSAKVCIPCTTNCDSAWNVGGDGSDTCSYCRQLGKPCNELRFLPLRRFPPT